MLSLYALVVMFCPGECIRIETGYEFKSEAVCMDVGAIEVGRRRTMVAFGKTIDYTIDCLARTVAELASEQPAAGEIRPMVLDRG